MNMLSLHEYLVVSGGIQCTCLSSNKIERVKPTIIETTKYYLYQWELTAFRSSREVPRKVRYTSDEVVLESKDTESLSSCKKYCSDIVGATSYKFGDVGGVL